MPPQQQVQQRRRGKTLFRRMLIFFAVVLMVQMLIYLAVFFKGGILDETENNAFYILSERTANRKLDLENEMVQRWSNVAEGKNNLLDAVGRTLYANSATAEELLTDPALCQEALAASAEGLVAMLRRNGVTGAFAVLDCADADGEYPGVYIRDYDPMNYASDNADLLLERGLPEVSRNLGIPMDSHWTAFFRFREEPDDAATYFSGPIDAVRAALPEERQEDYFYHWSGSFSLSTADRPVITYTVPLLWRDGTVIGVIGVDLTVDYLAEQLKYDELGGENSGAYFLGISTDGGSSYQTVCTSGPNFKAYFGQTERLTVVADSRAGIVCLPDPHHGERAIYGAVQPLRLYNNNTPFEGEQWALIGILSGEHLLKFAHSVRATLLVSAALSLLMGLVIMFMAARSFTRPISKLMSDLRRSDPNQPISLRPTNIIELDALSASIEDLSNAAAESASRISKIIAMSHIPIGVFEYRMKAGKVFCSRSLFEILDWPERPEDDLYLAEAEFLRRMGGLAVSRNSRGVLNDEQIFSLTNTHGERWVQLFYREEDENALGAFMDVTNDVKAKQKIEYERDYDILTGLYNRRAFDQRMERLFTREREDSLRTAALIMLDLDNLKYTNDTYGHDYGDRYIQAFAHCLECFYPFGGLVGRRSGDEFNVFLYGYGTEEEVRELVADFWNLVGKTAIDLPDGGQIRVRASGGMAWYGKDADDYTELLRLSDFAMYRVKRTEKGAMKEFNPEDYTYGSSD